MSNNNEVNTPPTTVTISIQTARIAQQAITRLNGSDGRTKVIIGMAEVELENVLADVGVETEPSSNGVATAPTATTT